jgi:hypothetical protein
MTVAHSAKTLGGGLDMLRNIRLDKAVPYEIDGGVRKKTKRLKCKVEPGARSPFVYLGGRGDEHGESGSGDVGADRR